MKISISNKKELIESLNKVHSVVEKRNTMQILSNVYLHAHSEKLIIKATDLEVSIETSLSVKMLEEGKASVSAKNFFDIIKELPEKEIQILSKDNHWIGISCGKSNFNIMGLAPEDFPSLPNFTGKNIFKAKANVLKNMIDHSLYSVSTDETRYQMNGVYLEPVEDKKYRMVATDGHRLAYFEDNLFDGNMDFLSKGILIPKKGIQEVRKLLETESHLVDVSLEGNHVMFKTGNSFLSIRLIEGQFPDYKQVIPKSNSKFVELDKNNFFDSLKRISLLANEKSKGIKLSLSSGKLEISSNNPDIGEATETIETSYKGDALEIGFNAKYLIDSLSVVNAPAVTFLLNDRMSPGVVKIPNSNEYLSVLMPMRL